MNVLALQRKDTAETLDDFYDQVEEQALLTVILQDAYVPILRAVHEAVRAALPPDIAESFRLDDAATRIVLAEAALRVVRIDETTRNAIREVLQEGQRLGLSAWEIANGKPSIGFRGIEQLYMEKWAGRAEMIARTELQQAQNVASVNRYTATGIIDRVQIVDGDFDDFCAARNGKIVPLAQAPGLAHPRCTLSLIPLLRQGIVA